MKHTGKAYNQDNHRNFSVYKSPQAKRISHDRSLKDEGLKRKKFGNKSIGEIIAFDKISGMEPQNTGEKKPYVFSNMIGRNSKMVKIFQQIIDVAEYNCPVHIFGETGTGKELLAEAIHKSSRYNNGPFVPINCGALPEGLVESELFGHVKGAFSGAVRDRKGRFELADGGTIFLDEVAELSKFMQVKLLRFLQDGKFERVGGEKTVSVNARIISATNKNLKHEMKKNRFRDDLLPD